MHCNIAEANGTCYWNARPTQCVEFTYFEEPLPHEALLAYVKKPFNLTTDVLLRVALIKVAEKQFRLVMVIHHLIMDGSKEDFMFDTIPRYYNDETYPEDAQFNYIDRATLAALASKFDAALNANLTGKIILVPTPDQADTVVQMAVTAVAAVEPNRGVVDYLPIRLITKPIKDAAMGKQQEVVVTMEMKMRDAKSDQVIYESLATTTGKTMGRSGDQVLRADMKTLDPVIEAWTEKVAQSLTKLQPGVAMAN